MSLTLGEKLRQAREDRGFSLSEVAEQTRISSLYLESIENDDYRILPGGIFNKGFVKSYAKLVGLNEQEALSDYAEITALNSTSDDDELLVYKPEVLTDDRSGSSMAPTIIFAVVILAIMTTGVYFFVKYWRPSDSPVANIASNTNTSSASDSEPVSEQSPTPSNAPEMADIKIEFKALSEPVSLTTTTDGKMASNVVTAGSTVTFEPKESLKLSYSKSLANLVQLMINGKAIILPAQPLIPRRNAIEFEINKDNLSQIWTSGAISTDVPAAEPDTNANITTLPADPNVIPPVAAPVTTPVRPTPAPKPSVAANTEVNPSPDKKPAETPKPVTIQPKPNANNQP